MKGTNKDVTATGNFFFSLGRSKRSRGHQVEQSQGCAVVTPAAVGTTRLQRAEDMGKADPGLSLPPWVFLLVHPIGGTPQEARGQALDDTGPGRRGGREKCRIDLKSGFREGLR